MTKEEMLSAMASLQGTHIAQMEKIKSAIAGKDIQNPTALGKLECECGIWFHKHEEQIKNILSLQLFERLDSAHEQWHRDYSKIYEIFFKEEKKTGFFSKFLGSKEIDEMQIDKAKLYFTDLEKDTQEVISASDSAKRRVSALSESKFV